MPEDQPEQLTQEQWDVVRDLVLTDRDAYCVTCGAGPYSEKSLHYGIDQGGECNLCFRKTQSIWPDVLE